MEIKYKKRKSPDYKVQAREIVKILDDQPHLLVRMEISGEHFPHRAPHPFVMIRVGKDDYFKDYFSEVSPNNQKLIGYLPINIPEGGIIVFGYGDEIWGTIPEEFDSDSIDRLDREKLPENLIVVDDDFIKRNN